MDLPVEREAGARIPSVAGIYGRLVSSAAVIVALDQLTKSLALDRLSDRPHDVIEGILTLRLTTNSGGVFGLLQGMPGLFLVATIVIVIVIMLWARKVEDPRWLVPLGFVLGGGLGNLTDRLFRDTSGEVIDFIDLHVWPIFNLADAAIVTGVLLILLFSSRSSKSSEG